MHHDAMFIFHTFCEVKLYSDYSQHFGECGDDVIVKWSHKIFTTFAEIGDENVVANIIFPTLVKQPPDCMAPVSNYPRSLVKWAVPDPQVLENFVRPLPERDHLFSHDLVMHQLHK